MSTWFHRIITIIHTYSISTKLHNLHILLGIPQGSGNNIMVSHCIMTVCQKVVLTRQRKLLDIVL